MLLKVYLEIFHFFFFTVISGSTVLPACSTTQNALTNPEVILVINTLAAALSVVALLSSTLADAPSAITILLADTNEVVMAVGSIYIDTGPI